MAAAGVVSCSDEPSKGDITRALNASLGQQAVCFAPEDMSKPEAWPLRLNDMNGRLLMGSGVVRLGPGRGAEEGWCAGESGRS